MQTQPLSVEEGNRLIAEFMAWTYNNPDENYPYPTWSTTDGRLMLELLFDSDWNELMPVVEKIEALGFQFKQCRRRVEIWEDKGSGQQVIAFIKEETKLSSAWKAVIDFIRWYSIHSEVKQK